MKTLKEIVNMVKPLDIDSWMKEAISDWIEDDSKEREVADILSIIAYHAGSQKHFEVAKACLEQSLDISLRLGNCIKPDIYMHLALCYAGEKNYIVAEDYLLKALEVCDLEGDSDIHKTITGNLSYVRKIINGGKDYEKHVLE